MTQTTSQVEHLKSLIDQYWALAYREGTEGRTRDTEDGAAQATLHEINTTIAALASQQEVANPWKEAVLDQLASHCMDAPIDEPPESVLRRILAMSNTMQQEVAAPVGDDVETMAASRYHIDKTEGGFWPYVVRCGNGTQVLHKGHLTSCQRLAQQLKTAFLDGAFVANKGVKADAALDATIKQRDRGHRFADEMAAQIAAITGSDIGEHSSSNCPWQQAVRAADDFLASARVPVASPAEPHAQHLSDLHDAHNSFETEWQRQQASLGLATPTSGAGDSVCPACKGQGGGEGWIADESDRSGQSDRKGWVDCQDCNPNTPAQSVPLGGGVVAAERQRCANICMSRFRSLSADGNHTAANEAHKCASAVLYASLGTTPTTMPGGSAGGADWGLDISTGTPILVYKNCSVIESEQARYVLRLIAADAGVAGVMDARPDSFHLDSGECGRVQGPGPTDPMNYKGMWLAAVSTLAKIDALLGLPDDGCNDPDMTLSALQDYMQGIKDIVGTNSFNIEDVRAWIAEGQARALAIDPDAAILASKGTT